MLLGLLEGLPTMLSGEVAMVLSFLTCTTRSKMNWASSINI